MALNEYDQFLEDLQKRNGADTAALKTSMVKAARAKPDDTARILDLSKRTGVAPDLIPEFKDDVEERAFLGDIDYDRLNKNMPATAAWLAADPHNAALSKDDIDVLGRIERTFSSIKRGWAKGSVQDELGGLHYRSFLGELDSVEESRRQKLKGDLGYLGREEAGVFGAPEYVSGQTAYTARQLLSSVREGIKGAAVGASAGALTAAAIGQAGPQIAAPEEIVTVPAFATAGGRTGYIAAAAMQSYRQEVGFAFDEFADLKDLDGAPMDRDIARGAAAAVGLLNAGLDTAGNVALAKMIPGLDKLLSRGPKDAIKQLLVRPTFRAALADAGKRWAKAATIEGVTEAVQELVIILGRESGQGVSGQEFSPDDAGDDAARIARAGIDALVGAGGVGAAGAGYQAYQGSREVRTANQNQRVLQALGDGATQSKVRERLPAKFQELVAKIRDRGDVDAVRIDGETFVKYFQSQGGDPYEVARAVMGDDKPLREAVEAGNDLAIPIDAYAAHLAATPHHQAIMQDLRLRPEDMTAREAQAFEKERETRVADFMKTMKDEGFGEGQRAEDPSTPIYEDALGQLIGTGMERGAAERQALLTQKAFSAMAGRANIDPMELWSQYSPRITRPLPEALRGKVSIDTSIDPILDALRTGAAPKNKEIFGPSLMDMLRERGLRDEGGELAARYVDVGLHASQRNLVRDDGMTMDEAVQMAQERGYLPGDGNYTPDMLLAAIDEEMRGTPRYSERNINQPLRERSESISRLGDYLGRLGIDLNSMTNEEVRKALLGKEDRDTAIDIVEAYYQGGNINSRGQLAIGQNRQMDISLLENSDLSTFLHESGHFYLEVMGDLAARHEVPQQIKDDFEALVKFAGFEVEAWRSATLEQRRDGHEKVARAFEAYLMEGKAPSLELQGAFSRFRSWLLGIYKQIRNLDVELTKEVRKVFGRMLATDEEISAAQEMQNYVDIFATAEDAGMRETAFEKYRKTIESAHEQAVTRLNVELQEGWKREEKQWWQDRRDEVRAEVEKEVNASRIYVAIAALKKGTLPDGSPLPEGATSIKLDKGALEALYGEAKRGNSIMDKLRGHGMYRNEGGVHPDIAAEMFGYESGDRMIQEIVNAQRREEAIDAETDVRMREIFPDPLTDGSIAERAMHAIHNDKRAEVLAIELQALKRKMREVHPFLREAEQAERAALRNARDTGVTQVELATMREAARMSVAGMRVRDIAASKYRMAEAKAARKAFQAATKKDWAAAYGFKRQQAFNHALYMAARDASEQAGKVREYMAGLSKKAVQERVGKGSPDYLDALNAILDAYEFRRVPKKALDLSEVMRAAVRRAEIQGEILDVMTDDEGAIIDPVILNVKNYQELTYEELIGVYDTAKNIVHIARETRNFRAAAENAEFDDLVARSLAEMDEGPKERKREKRSLRTPWQEKKRFIAGIPASWRGLQSYISKATGYDELARGLNNTTLMRYTVHVLSNSAAREAVMLNDAATRLDAIFHKYKRDYLYGKGKYIDGVGSLNLQEKIMIVASYGSTTGRQRLLDNGPDGDGFTQDQVNKIIDSLDERDFQTVKELWIFLGEFWPKVVEKQKRVTGVAPEAVAPAPFMTRFGEMPGGYMTIAYEGLIDNRAAEHDAAQIAKEMKQAAYTRSTTRRGFVNNRVKELHGRAVRYDFGVVYRHLNEVIHDLTHHEVLRDVQKLLNHKLDGRSIMDGITARLGPEARDEIRKTLEDIAVGDLRAMSATEMAFEKLARGATIAGLAYSVWTALQNSTGIMNSMAIIGPKAVFSGAMQWIGSPKHMLKTIDEVHEKSEMMRTRFINMNRDISSFRGKLEARTGSETVDAVYQAYRDGGFWMLVRMQQLVDIPTWLGAYNAAKRADPAISEENAVALADQSIIELQGGGRTVDLSQWMRSKGFGRVFTVYAGFFNVVYQRVVESFERAHIKGYSPAAVGRMVTDVFFLTMAPVMLTLLLKEAINVGSGGEADDEEGLALKLLKEQVAYILAMFPFVRETAAGLLGYGMYSGPVGTRFFKEVNDLGRQITQGEVDEPLAKEVISVGGYFVGLPTTQILRTYEGVKVLDEDNATPLVLVFGPPKETKN